VPQEAVPRQAWRRSGVDGSDAPAPGPASDADRAREICLRLLAFRPRTRQELASALRQRGIPADVSDEVLARYSEVGMVDDGAFARAWVTSRHHGKGLAGRALAGELRRKGVEADAIGAALDEIGGDVQARTARELVDRKMRGDRGGSPDATLRRLVGMLARKGYPPGLAFRVVRDALAEADMSVDEDAESLEAALEAEAAQADDES
jgi:regulatory protein